MNEKRRQSFRVTHLFSPHSAETKPRQGASLGPTPGPMASGTAPVLTLTTVPSVLLNPWLAWLLLSVWPQHVWISHKTEHHAVSWPLLKYPCVPPYCLPQRGLGGGGGGLLGPGGSMATKKPDLGTGNCLKAKRRKKQNTTTCSLRVGQRAVIRLTYLSVSRAGTPSAFHVTTAFAFVSFTSCQVNSSTSNCAHSGLRVTAAATQQPCCVFWLLSPTNQFLVPWANTDFNVFYWLMPILWLVTGKLNYCCWTETKWHTVIISYAAQALRVRHWVAQGCALTHTGGSTRGQVSFQDVPGCLKSCD